MAQIFISYSRSDKPFVDQFVPLIRATYGNDSLWFDNEIRGGQDWWQSILSEIAACNLFIFLISNESLRSDYCQDELREALRLNKQILPVIVRRLIPAYPGEIDPDLAEVLKKIHYIDMSEGFTSPDILAALYGALHTLLPVATSKPARPEHSVSDKAMKSPKLGSLFISAVLLIAVIASSLFIFSQKTLSEPELTPVSSAAVNSESTQVETATNNVSATEGATLVPAAVDTNETEASSDTVLSSYVWRIPHDVCADADGCVIRENATFAVRSIGNIHAGDTVLIHGHTVGLDDNYRDYFFLTFEREGEPIDGFMWTRSSGMTQELAFSIRDRVPEVTVNLDVLPAIQTTTYRWYITAENSGCESNCVLRSDAGSQNSRVGTVGIGDEILITDYTVGSDESGLRGWFFVTGLASREAIEGYLWVGTMHNDVIRDVIINSYE